MADPQPPSADAAPAAAATADLESKEIWGDEADQLDEEIMKVRTVLKLFILAVAKKVAVHEALPLVWQEAMDTPDAVCSSSCCDCGDLMRHVE